MPFQQFEHAPKDQKVELFHVAAQALYRKPSIRKMLASRCNESWIWAFKTMPLWPEAGAVASESWLF